MRFIDASCTTSAAGSTQQRTLRWPPLDIGASTISTGRLDRILAPQSKPIIKRSESPCHEVDLGA